MLIHKDGWYFVYDTKKTRVYTVRGGDIADLLQSLLPTYAKMAGTRISDFVFGEVRPNTGDPSKTLGERVPRCAGSFGIMRSIDEIVHTKATVKFGDDIIIVDEDHDPEDTDYINTLREQGRCIRCGQLKHTWDANDECSHEE